MKNKNRVEKLRNMANKMGIEMTETIEMEENNMNYSKMMDISKPDRPEVKEFFKRQLEAVGRMNEQ